RCLTGGNTCGDFSDASLDVSDVAGVALKPLTIVVTNRRTYRLKLRQHRVQNRTSLLVQDLDLALACVRIPEQAGESLLRLVNGGTRVVRATVTHVKDHRLQHSRG